MSPIPSSPTAASAERYPAPQRKSALDAFLIAVGAIVLIGTEIWLAALAIAWAAHGLLGLGVTGDIVLVLLVAPPALWATWKVATMAISAERNAEEDF
ncbi:hypothetical protein DFR52_102929 [Hoeflea marina]|uniref:Uncharacterized protein n=1 Tax=Hoeflea marina TaxID=274592 RepID=A0A317PPP5_9HYPH|nr:hypothetical protein [Hoeflea marina]PWW02261.1 hypothetical protein DFR52_102929 [Hoeflea marina]